MRGKIVGYGDKTKYFIDNVEVTMKEFKGLFPDRPIGQGEGLIGWKPILSDALAVHPLDVVEAIRDAEAKGVPTEFLPDGRPILRSREHRKEYMKAYGFFDRDAGYGDAQRDGHRNK